MGFEEAISIAHSMSSGGATNDNSFTFAMPSTAGYVYNVYFDKTHGGGNNADSNLALVASNVAASATSTVTAIGSTGASPPAAPPSGLTIHPVYLLGAEALNWVGLQNLETFITEDKSVIGNVL